MPALDFRRRPLSSDHSGRVFFSAHPDDTTKCTSVIDDVLALTDCIACFDGDPLGEENAEWCALLSDMQLFVVLVSEKFLREPSRAKNAELPLAKEKHIPILPILTESVSLEEYNRVFPDIQYLDPKDKSDAALPYSQKLERALGEVLQSSSARARIRDSFELSFFLSYRKKDRRGAQELLEKIHSRDKFRSVAVWYDEFLLPGEDFNHSIEEAMNQSSAFLMSVTPHMLEPTNYVLDVEFPAAVEKEMKIVAVETQSTDKSDFSDKFKDAPPLIPLEDEERLFSALEGITGTALSKENTAEHTYYLGLAYLGGICVEVNRPLGVRLIKEAAEKDYAPAVEKLILMYRCGEGVERSYAEATKLRRRLIELLYADFSKIRTADALDDYLSAMIALGDEYRDLGDYSSARDAINRARTESDRLRGERHLNGTAALYTRIAVQRLSAIERLAGNLDEAILILKSNLPFFRFEAEESGESIDRRGLAVLLEELSNLYIEKGLPAKAEKFAKEAMEINESLVSGESSSALDRYNLSVNLFNKALSLSSTGAHDAAIETALRGIDTVSSAMDHRESYALFIRFHLLLGEEYGAKGSLGEAKSAVNAALDICESPATPQDIVTLKLKAEALSSLGELTISEGNLMGARSFLRAADDLFGEIIEEGGEKKMYHSRAKVAFMDAQVCYNLSLFSGAKYNYEKCIEYMEAYTEEAPKPKDLHVLALASFLLGAMNRQSPDVSLLQKAFTIWSELADGEGGEEYAPFRDEVASMLIRFMF